MRGNNDSNAQDFVAGWSTWRPGETRPTTFNAALNLRRYPDEIAAYNAGAAVFAAYGDRVQLSNGIFLGAGITPGATRAGISAFLFDVYGINPASPGLPMFPGLGVPH